MSEKTSGLQFHHAPYGNFNHEYEPTGNLAEVFKNTEADFVSPSLVEDYIQQVVEDVKSNPNIELQKACVMDLLREENILKLLKDKEIEGKDKEEVEKMTLFWVKKIKTKIVEELKKHLPDDLYFFISHKEDDAPPHFNKKSIITDTRSDREYFFKESDFSFKQIQERVEECLKILQSSIKDISNSEKEMPFIIIPKKIGKNTRYGYPDNTSLSYLSNKEDLTPVENIISITKENGIEVDYLTLDQNNTKITVNAILDCLRGTQFLAKNGLTLTDLNTFPIGKNFGINNKVGHGVLFDLDGLQKVGTNLAFLLGPKKADGRIERSLVAPEYKYFGAGTKEEPVATAESMIWEIGDSILRLSNLQAESLFKSPNFFANHRLVSLWEKLRDFSKKMTAEKPADRPPFDICISKIEEIINKFSEQK